MNNENETIIIGKEYDGDLRKSLILVLKKMGASLIEQKSAIAGSQDIYILKVMLLGEEVHIESETYIGLSISGSKKVVERIMKELKDFTEV